METPLLVALVLSLAPPQEGNREKALVGRAVRSIELFETYLDRWPRTLEELKQKPPEVRFWPDGGFWIGALPESVRWENGTVRCGGEKQDVRAPLQSPIVPPTERLKNQYTARIQILLLRAFARSLLEEHGRLPTKAADLGGIPKDPWGNPYVVEFLKDRLRIRSASFRERWAELGDVTPEEKRRLDEASIIKASPEEVRAIEKLLDRMADDDYETRLEATAELRRRGRLVRPSLEARRKKVNDPFVRRWLARLAREFPERPPAWRDELRPLSLVLMARVDPAALVSCSNNLSQLWKMQNIYMSQYGGRMKRMPKATGKEFWLALARTPRPLIDATNLDIFVCPASGQEPAKDWCGYAGPDRDVNGLNDWGRIVGLCDDEAHGDQAVILRRAGDVQTVPRYGPLHQKALRETRR